MRNFDAFILDKYSMLSWASPVSWRDKFYPLLFFKS
jgi:hypothetical protein